MKTFMFSLYTLVLALWVGGTAVVTFIITPTIFRSFGRDLAGEIVGRLFPGYFLGNLVLTALALILFFLVAGDIQRPAARLCFALLTAVILINAYTEFRLYPKTVAVKRQIPSFGSESPDSPARRQFARLHALGAVLNLLQIADGITLLVVSPLLKQ